MKPYYSIFAALSLCLTFHQVSAQRNVLLKDYGKDSLLVGFNSQYYVVDDSCVEIVRHCRFNFEHKRFLGGFKDVKKEDTTKTIAQGSYNKEGQKDGPFISYYLNGNLQAEGTFHNNRYSGDWAFYYEDGSPELIFTATNDVISIHNAWDEDHKKLIDSGNGVYRIPYMLTYYWTGSLFNGRPDGEWRLFRRYKSDTSVVLLEHWDNGKFLSGENQAQNYTDSTRIVLVNNRKLALIQAEKLTFLKRPCWIVDTGQNVVNAKYLPGDKKLFTFFDELCDDFMQSLFKNKKAVPSYTQYFFVSGEIDESGHLVNLTSVNSVSAKYMMDCLKRYVPQFQPATANGKPVRQQIVFFFNFYNGEVHYRYDLAPVML